MSKLFVNKRWAFFVVVFAVLIVSGLWTLREDPGVSAAIMVLGSVLLLGYVFLVPNGYRMDDRGIAVYYGFGIKTIARWEDLHIVEERHDKAFPRLREYRIGYFKTKNPLWEKAYIPKNRKTAARIEKYYTKSIEKFI